MASIDALADRLSANAIVTDAGDIAPWLTDWRGRWTGASPLLLQPSTPEEVAVIVRAAEAHGGRIIDRHFLDHAVPDRPVLVVHIAGHWGVVNSTGLKLAGLTDASSDPHGGFLGIRDISLDWAAGNTLGPDAHQAFVQSQSVNQIR